ncbi:mechanosensitive ion channel [Inhella sp. 4Y17]|uniref:Mechanosensitive ion channel n=2 Tax=Inhella gelatinilytica TaxID=2795030 RepID=A0A931IVR4_9BURK|nr:mechanosensitive ion channel [Inhella gelatinilytica]
MESNTVDEWSQLLGQRGVSWEALALGVGLALAWVLVRALASRREGEAGVLLGRHGVDGLFFPLLLMLLTYALIKLWPAFGFKPALLKLVQPIWISLAVIRLVVRVLQAALPASRGTLLAERWVAWLAWGGSVLWITGLWPAAMEELESIAWKLGGSTVSLRSLLEGAVAVVVILVGALWLSAVLESRLLKNSAQNDLSARKIIANLIRAGLLFTGLLLALSIAGIDLTALSVLGGALGVGLGFGLQKLAANYVSGFVILAERSLRIGDVVKVDGFEGRITDIKTRYTVIRALNGRESVVPNELLITQRVENSSLADPKVLLSTAVTVGYETDLEPLMAALQTTVAAVPRVQQDPGPVAQLHGFGADGLDLHLHFWIADPENGSGNVRSDVNRAILNLLRTQGISIPYPQRVVHQR